MVKLVTSQDAIPGIEVPKDVYWVLREPVPLAGMRFPKAVFPWQQMKQEGFSCVVSLQPGRLEPKPLERIFDGNLQDLSHGGPPDDEAAETAKVKSAVAAVLAALEEKKGVVVHCQGGRGRTGAVIGCVLREYGVEFKEIISFFDRIHRWRGKAGWPEAPWQSDLVRNWGRDG